MSIDKSLEHIVPFPLHFFTAKLPGYIRVGNGDDITGKYILLTTAHDGSGSITAAFTPSVSCAKTPLNAALKGMGKRLKHRDGYRIKIVDGKKLRNS